MRFIFLTMDGNHGAALRQAASELRREYGVTLDVSLYNATSLRSDADWARLAQDAAGADFIFGAMLFGEEYVRPLQKLLADKKVSLELTPQARELLFKAGYDPAYGARPLRRALQQLVQDKLALKMLDGEILPGDQVVADADSDRGELVFEKVASSKQAVN